MLYCCGGGGGKVGADSFPNEIKLKKKQKQKYVQNKTILSISSKENGKSKY